MALRYPLLTIILILLTLAAVGFLKVFKKINKGTYFVGNLKTFKSKTDNSLKNTVRNLTKYAQIGFLTVAIFSLILLTSRPTRNINNSQKSGGIDIMVSLDMSRSMFEEDFKPNRLEASTKVINDFIEKLESDRIGLVLFAGNTYALSPLTFDYSIIQTYLKDINPETQYRYFTEQGTAIGESIASCTSKFQENVDRAKVIILLTDGVPTQDDVDALDAAKYAASKDIKIYAIYIGNPDDEQTFGGSADGMETLEKVTGAAQGKTFSARDTNALNDIFDEIQELEKKEIETNSETLKTDNPAFLINVSLISISLYFAITYLRKFGWL